MYPENNFQNCDYQILGSTQTIERILRLPTLLAAIDISAATLWRWVKDESFPKPISLGGRSVGWLQSEVQAWVKARVMLRNKTHAAKCGKVQP